VINVSHAPVPSGVSVFSSHTGLDYFFSVINPQNTTEYSWDFGDGTVINGPSTITHTYATAGQYTITVILTNNDNCGADTLTTTVVNTTGVQEEADLTGIRIYPNPASDIVTIANDQNLSVEGIRIYDISGKMVYNSNGNTIDMKLNVSGWENGMYIVYIEAEAKQSVHRLIVAR
jgi:PKD repeat protein